MRRIIFYILTGLTALGFTTALAGDLAPLILPAELAKTMTTQDAVILDIRPEGYDKGHIEGAVSAPYGLFRGPAANPGAVPSVLQLEIAYKKLGLEPQHPVIIVSQGDTDTDFGAAARVYWTLKSTGFTNIAVLNGGATGWVNAGLPLSTENVMPIPTDLQITWNESWTADTAAVARIVTGADQGKLIDARPISFFDGKRMHDAAARPGTLPGAKNLPYTEFFRPGATVIDPATDIAALKAKLGYEQGESVVSFCNTGHWAATEWFALSELAGIEDVKLYPGSMVEYSQTGGEMSNQPGLFANLFSQLWGN